MTSDTRPSPLAGLRVLDFGQYVAGPLLGRMLADQGAEVVAIDPPGGPRWDHPSQAFYRRGKEARTLDLKSGAGRAEALRLVRSADVLIENFRPGVMERLGLGAPAAMAANPRLVYLSLPGFAANDPRAAMPGWEGVVCTAGNGYLPPWDGRSLPGEEGRPLFSALPLASSYAAFLASAVTVFALHARHRDGHGRRIEVPLFDALFQAFGAYAMSGEGAGNPAFSSDIWGAGCYRCGDGRWVMWATHNPRFMEALVAVGGVAEWRALGLLDRPRLQAEPALLAELRRRVAALFATRPAHAWEEALSAAGAPLTLVRSPREWIESPHALAVEAVVEAEDPALGRHRQPGRPVRLSGAAQPANGSAPGAPAPAPAAQPLRHLLEGLKVVDLTQVLAGPTAARLMAELGAEVVKVNDPANPPQGYRYHLDVNRGKRTLLLDLKRPAGRDLFLRLAADADVVLQNFARGVPERLGIGRETLMAANPRLVHGTVSAYGQEGPAGAAPWGGRRGYEPLGQAMTGMQWRFGGPDSPLMEPLAVCDYGTGLLAAFGVGLALLQRQQSGQGLAVEASLAHTGTWLQTPWLLLAGEAMPEVPGGRAALGFGPLQRFYRAADGWFFLGTRPEELAAMTAVEGLAGIDGLEGAALEAALAERFATAPLAVWQERLAPLDVGLAAHRPIEELMRDPWVVAQGLSITRDHEGVGRVTGIGPSARIAPSPPVPGRPVRPPGADGRELLAELGLGAAEIEALVRDGVMGGSGATPPEEPLVLRGV